MCATNIRHNGCNMTQSIPMLSANNSSPKFMLSSRIWSKCIFPFWNFGLRDTNRFYIDKDIIRTLVTHITYSPNKDVHNKNEGVEDHHVSRSKVEVKVVLIWHREVAAIAKARALILFKQTEANGNFDGAQYSYIVTSPKTDMKIFNLAKSYMSCGTTFRMT